MKKFKVEIVNGSPAYRNLFIRMGFDVVDGSGGKPDLICFTGGADVTSSLYGDKSHPFTGSDLYRDKWEKEIYIQALADGIPMVGICRGGQFLNVMSGGRMYQHVDKHVGDHYLIDRKTGESIMVSSTHHQMMMPTDEAVLIASSILHGAREWYDGQIARRDISDEDIEVVYYPVTKCLCFQPHPEFTGPQYVRMANYFAGLVEKLLGYGGFEK